MDLRGALRYHGVDARRLGEVLRVRTVSRLVVDVCVGIGRSVTIAATASGQLPLPGGALAIAPEDVTGWLGTLPIDALQRIGPRQAAALRDGLASCRRSQPWPPMPPGPTTTRRSSKANTPTKPCPPTHRFSPRDSRCPAWILALGQTHRGTPHRSRWR